VFARKSREYEGGWLTGKALDLSDRPVADQPSRPNGEPTTPISGVQLTLL